jgi:hypothetical protein
MTKQERAVARSERGEGLRVVAALVLAERDAEQQEQRAHRGS